MLVSNVLLEGEPDPTLLAAKGVDFLLVQLWRLEEEAKDVIVMVAGEELDRTDWAYSKVEQVCGVLKRLWSI